MNIRTYQANPWRFFALALGISWFFWMWIILFGRNVWSFPAIVLGALGLFGPALAEIVLISRTHDKEQWRDYWQRVFDFKRIGRKWCWVIFATFPVVNALAILLAVFNGSSLPTFETVHQLISEPWRILPFAVFILLFGPLPEELGWRGYALDGLQTRFTALGSSLILGVVWALWHVPLFFMKGTFQHDQLRFATLNFWIYLSGPVFVSILFTWLYNNTNRSTLAAILFHFMINFTAELIPLNKQGRLYSLILIVVLTVVVTTVFGPESLIRKNRGERKIKVAQKNVPAHFFGRGTFPSRMSFWLDFPLRRFVLSPWELADRLHLKSNARVLEIGPGPGYFSAEVARRVPDGRLELFDLQRDMLEKSRRKLEAAGVGNADVIQGDAANLPFDNNTFDVVFMVAVLGEVSDKATCLGEIHRVLKPAGLLSVTEQPGDPDFLPLPVVRSLTGKNGFEFTESCGRGRNYTANFIKR